MARAVARAEVGCLDFLEGRRAAKGFKRSNMFVVIRDLCHRFDRDCLLSINVNLVIFTYRYLTVFGVLAAEFYHNAF